MKKSDIRQLWIYPSVSLIKPKAAIQSKENTSQIILFLNPNISSFFLPLLINGCQDGGGDAVEVVQP